MPTWKKLPGLAKDIAVDAAGVAWVIGTTPTQGGFALRRFNKVLQRWDDIGGVGGVRISCGSTSPVVVNDVGEISYLVGYWSDWFPFASGLRVLPIWRRLNGRASDVGAGGVRGQTFDQIYKADAAQLSSGYDVSAFEDTDWVALNKKAVSIACSHTLYSAQGETVGIIDEQNEIWVCGFGKSWRKLPGTGKDIALGAGELWIIGTDLVGSNYSVFRWSGVSGKWEQVPRGFGVRIACGPDGLPWVVNAADEIWQYSS